MWNLWKKTIKLLKITSVFNFSTLYLQLTLRKDVIPQLQGYRELYLCLSIQRAPGIRVLLGCAVGSWLQSASLKSQSCIQRLWFCLFLKNQNSKQGENSPNVTGRQNGAAAGTCSQTRALPSLWPIVGSWGQGLTLLVVHGAEGLLLWQSLFWLFREPTGRVWHAVRGLGQRGEGRHITVLRVFCQKTRGRIGDKHGGIFCLINNWF